MNAVSPFSISVVIPARNAAGTIAHAVHSATSQLPPPDRVLVVDDGSNDGTSQQAQQAGADVLRHSRSRGAAAARDAGARATRSGLIAFLDADDAYAPGYLAAVARAVEHAPHASLILGTSVEHLEDGRIQRPRPYSADELAHPVAALAWDNRVPTSATTVPRWAYEQSGGFDPDFPGTAAEDYDLWLRLALCGVFTRAVDALVHRTITAASFSRRPDALELMLRNAVLGVARNRDAASRVYPPFARVATAHVHREAARRALALGDAAAARALLRTALRCNPLDDGVWALAALGLFPAPVRPMLLAARRLVLSRREQLDAHLHRAAV